MKKNTNRITLASIFSGISVVLIIIGSALELFDLTVAALCAMIVYVSMIEIKGKYPLLIFFTVSILSFIIVPMTTATLYYIAFFGYYPILRYKLKKFGKIIQKLLCFTVFNSTMILLYIIFKAVFALHNEPPLMYVILLITSNIFFICFDFALDVFAFIYIKKIRPKLGLK